MKRPVNRARGALLWLALTAVACGHEIGDSCKSSVDCDPNGTRSCDLSQPGGYCTVVGCDETSCPESSTCIRLFPQMFLAASATQCGDGGTCADGGTCTAGGYCTQCDPKLEDVPTDAGVVQNNCLADEICLDTGLCAKQSYEQRECAKSCSGNGDCRGGYECRKAGEQGSMVLATDPLATTSFCAPFVAPMSVAP
jgi:hypothetical protein